MSMQQRKKLILGLFGFGVVGGDYIKSFGKHLHYMLRSKKSALNIRKNNEMPLRFVYH